MIRDDKHVNWKEARTRLDQNGPFSNMYDTPYYRDAVYDQFSKAEYARRHAALREKMREHKLDCVIVPGGPSHWSFGGGMDAQVAWDRMGSCSCWHGVTTVIM